MVRVYVNELRGLIHGLSTLAHSGGVASAHDEKPLRTQQCMHVINKFTFQQGTLLNWTARYQSTR